MPNETDELYFLPLEKKVRKANELIQKSRFDLSLQQQKIILFLISQISPFDENFKTYNFDIREFCRICGIDFDNGRNYELLKEQIKKIADKSMWLMLDDDTESLIRWIEKPRIKKKSGIIQIRLDEDLKPYLLQLRRNFTQYEIIYTLNFKSKYTIRLYELVKSIHFHDLEPYKRTFTVDELKRILGAENYKTYQHFKDRALNPAVKEINNFSDKNVSYTCVKTGKRITGITLTVESKEPNEIAKISAEIEKSLAPNQMLFSGAEW